MASKTSNGLRDISLYLVMAICGLTLPLAYLTEVMAAEKKSQSSTKQSNQSAPSSDSKRFDELKLTSANVWRCENNILVKTAESSQGYLMLWNNRLFVMNKIDALSGVQRYTNDKASLNWIEIPDKAMLFDFKVGQRLLDYCKTPELAAQVPNQNKEDLFK